MPIAIDIANPAVTPVNDHVGALVTSNLAGYLESLSLGIGDAGGSLVPGAFNGPFSATWNDMLILPQGSLLGRQSNQL